MEVLPQAAVKIIRVMKEIKRSPVRFFTKVRSYSIVYDNDSHSRLYLNMIEEKMHRLFYDQNENGEILPVF
ncbi:hypothetical protein [Bacillus altitudinis]|nr:hypothetical protein [Bacillus altitudinis]